MKTDKQNEIEELVEQDGFKKSKGKLRKKKQKNQKPANQNKKPTETQTIDPEQPTTEDWIEAARSLAQEGANAKAERDKNNQEEPAGFLELIGKGLKHWADNAKDFFSGSGDSDDHDDDHDYYKQESRPKRFAFQKLHS